MTAQTLRRAAFWIGAALAIASAGCSSGSDTNASSRGAGASSSSSGGGGNGGAGGGGEGEGGAGGGGGGMTADNGHSATETVTAGEVAKSPSYKMIFTFGQPTQNQDKTTSPGYRIQGGLVGANGSAP
jgi:hypothetical protein